MRRQQHPLDRCLHRNTASENIAHTKKELVSKHKLRQKKNCVCLFCAHAAFRRVAVFRARSNKIIRNDMARCDLVDERCDAEFSVAHRNAKHINATTIVRVYAVGWLRL